MGDTYKELVEELKELGYTYGSEHAGGGFREVWWRHPSGSAVNLDLDPERPDINRRLVNSAPSSIIRHEFQQKAAAKAAELAAAEGLRAERHYYLCDYDDREMDWSYSFVSKGGTALRYVRGKELLPDEYAAVAEHFKRTK